MVSKFFGLIFDAPPPIGHQNKNKFALGGEFSISSEIKMEIRRILPSVFWRKKKMEMRWNPPNSTTVVLWTSICAATNLPGTCLVLNPGPIDPNWPQSKGILHVERGCYREVSCSALCVVSSRRPTVRAARNWHATACPPHKLFITTPWTHHPSLTAWRCCVPEFWARQFFVMDGVFFLLFLTKESVPVCVDPPQNPENEKKRNNCTCKWRRASPPLLLSISDGVAWLWRESCHQKQCSLLLLSSSLLCAFCPFFIFLPSQLVGRQKKKIKKTI